MRQRVRLVAAAACGALLLLGACSGDTDGAGSGSSPPATPSDSFASIPGAEAFPAGEPITLVYLSDSASISAAEAYGELAAEALDREVRVISHYVGGLRDMPSAVQSWSDEVAQAGIVVVYGNTGDIEPPRTIGTCVWSSGWGEEPDATPHLEGEPPVISSPEDWQQTRDVLAEVYSAIWDLRQGQPTIIRTHDFFNPFLEPWTELGIEGECKADWEVLSEVLRGAAEDNGVGMASLLDVFNGPSHDEDPRQKGWISDDGAHASDEGIAMIVDALASVGFDATQPTS